MYKYTLVTFAIIPAPQFLMRFHWAPVPFPQAIKFYTFFFGSERLSRLPPRWKGILVVHVEIVTVRVIWMRAHLYCCVFTVRVSLLKAAGHQDALIKTPLCFLEEDQLQNPT